MDHHCSHSVPKPFYKGSPSLLCVLLTLFLGCTALLAHAGTNNNPFHIGNSWKENTDPVANAGKDTIIYKNQTVRTVRF